MGVRRIIIYPCSNFWSFYLHRKFSLPIHFQRSPTGAVVQTTFTSPLVAWCEAAGCSVRPASATRWTTSSPPTSPWCWPTWTANVNSRNRALSTVLNRGGNTSATEYTCKCWIRIAAWAFMNLYIIYYEVGFNHEVDCTKHKCSRCVEPAWLCIYIGHALMLRNWLLLNMHAHHTCSSTNMYVVMYVMWRHKLNCLNEHINSLSLSPFSHDTHTYTVQCHVYTQALWPHAQY